MSGERREFSPVDQGFVRIEKQPDGLHRVTVLRRPDSTDEADVVSVHLRCKRVDVAGDVRLVSAGGATSSVAPVVVYQSYSTKTVMIISSRGD